MNRLFRGSARISGDFLRGDYSKDEIYAFSVFAEWKFVASSSS